MARAAVATMMADPWEAMTVTVRHGGRFVCPPHWSIPATRVHYSTLFYIERGHGWVQRDSDRREARPGDLFFNVSGHVYSAGHDQADPVTVLSVGLELRGPAGLDPLHRLTLPDRLTVPEAQHAKLVTAYEEAIAAWKSGHPLSRLTARALGLRLLAVALEIADAAPPEARDGEVPSASPEPRIARVLEHLETHLADELDLPTLAAIAGLSPAHFATTFRQATGQSPMRFVRQRRVSVARQHLAAGHLTVEQVARQVGFDDPFHFSRVFRKATGIAPREYSRAARNPFASP